MTDAPTLYLLLWGLLASVSWGDVPHMLVRANDVMSQRSPLVLDTITVTCLVLSGLLTLIAAVMWADRDRSRLDTLIAVFLLATAGFFFRLVVVILFGWQTGNWWALPCYLAVLVTAWLVTRELITTLLRAAYQQRHGGE